MRKLYINAVKNDEPTFNKKDYLLEAAKRLGLDYVELYTGQEDSNYVLNVEPFAEFVKGKKWTGIWEIDLMLNRDRMKIDNWIASDMVFLSNIFYPKRMMDYKGEKMLLFQACDPIIHRRDPQIEQKYDFVFSGSMGLDVYKERERVYKLMSEKFLFQSFNKGNSPQEYIKLLNQARVQFIRSGANSVSNSQVEQRFFECLAIGPVLKDYHGGLEFLGLEEGRDYFSYKNDDEMIGKMQYLINNPEFAKIMAENGRKKALQHHSYDHRLITILNVIRDAEKL